jgi:hypothetical protein
MQQIKQLFLGIALFAVSGIALAGDFYIAPAYSSFELKRASATFTANDGSLWIWDIGGKFTGSLTGATLGYKSDRDIFRAKADYMSSSDMDHEIDIVSVKDSGEQMRYYSFEMAFGGKFKIVEKFSASPYIGLGSRSLSQDSYRKSRFTHNYHSHTSSYFMLGADWNFVPVETWNVSLNTEFQVLINGTTKAGGGGAKLEYDQGSGSGIKLSLKGEKDFKSVKLFLEPYYQKWEISKSKSESMEFCTDTTSVWNCYATYQNVNLTVPKYTTTETGLRIGLAF